MAAGSADIYIPRVYIFGPNHVSYVKMFLANGYLGTNNIDEADFVMFTGGVDINPAMYAERCLTSTHFNPERDRKDTSVYDECVTKYIPMVGVCRGAQLLNVLNGGSLYQDVNNHHTSVGHPIIDHVTGQSITVTSRHHQGMIPSTLSDEQECVVLATCGRSTRRATDLSVETGLSDDYEVLFYPSTQSLCYQPHPEEVGKDGYFKAGQEYFFNLLLSFIDVNSSWFKPIKGSTSADEDEFRKLVVDMEKRERAVNSTFAGCSTMFDTHSGRTVYIDADGTIVGYADLNDDNRDDDPLDLWGLGTPEGNC